MILISTTKLFYNQEVVLPHWENIFTQLGNWTMCLHTNVKTLIFKLSQLVNFIMISFASLQTRAIALMQMREESPDSKGQPTG